MAETQAKKPPSRKAKAAPPLRSWRRLVLRWTGRVLGGIAAFYVALVLLFSFVPPPINLYQLSETFRLGGIDKDWVDIEEIAPVMARAVVAAEDANFCNHWGFDMTAIRAAVAEGGNRGASTLSQQVTKNVFLWHGRSWLRKAMEAVLTPAVELVWSKRRILEVYLNVAEFDEGAARPSLRTSCASGRGRSCRAPRPLPPTAVPPVSTADPGRGLHGPLPGG